MRKSRRLLKNRRSSRGTRQRKLKVKGFVKDTLAAAQRRERHTQREASMNANVMALKVKEYERIIASLKATIASMNANVTALKVKEDEATITSLKANEGRLSDRIVYLEEMLDFGQVEYFRYH